MTGERPPGAGLRRTGPRRTRQRAAVDQVLGASDEFRTAQQLHDDLRRSGVRVGLTTVYRRENDFREADHELEIFGTCAHC